MVPESTTPCRRHHASSEPGQTIHHQGCCLRIGTARHVPEQVHTQCPSPQDKKPRTDASDECKCQRGLGLPAYATRSPVRHCRNGQDSVRQWLVIYHMTSGTGSLSECRNCFVGRQSTGLETSTIHWN
ncbi:hypothetical protein L227DRAFT_579465, partial [Lentinus tigrinus ALCF2SS1-6]